MIGTPRQPASTSPIGSPVRALPSYSAHNFLRTGYQWHAIAPVVAERYRVNVLDCRGPADRPKGSYDKSTMTRDVHGASSDASGLSERNVAHVIGTVVSFALAWQLRNVTTTTLNTMNVVLPGTPTSRELVAEADSMLSSGGGAITSQLVV